ncbi:MAG: DUF427 domain-containing protein [Bacteroidales bacterium]|nr:DUF427 domain-containing protein [Bacteroidales bacterium]
MKAIWNDKVIAESDDTIVIEGNHYFPRGAVNKEFLKESETHTTCHWKGVVIRGCVFKILWYKICMI